MRLSDIITGLIAPNLCEVCGRELVEGERSLCIHCIARLPLCMQSRDDLRIARLPRTMPIKGVYPWLTYTNSNPVCGLIREGKYNNRPELIKSLARLYAHSLMAEHRFDGVDCLVPVPMHWWKRMRRGYNQAAVIAETLAEESGVRYADRLKACRGHRSQTLHSREGRLENVKSSMALRKGADVAGLHIGVIDDILTTGATLTEAIRALTSGGASRISVFTLAATES